MENESRFQPDYIDDYDEDQAGASTSSAQADKKDNKGYVSIHSSGFRDFLLKPELLKAISDRGFEHPSQVQHECIPQAILSMDVLCQAKSGMGKTAVFALSVLQQLEPIDKQVSVLVITHTRELAQQVCDEFRKFSKYIPEVKAAVFYGGRSIKMDEEDLEKRCPNIVVGTPGRLKALVTAKKLSLGNLKHFIIDECDIVLKETGMREDVQRIFMSTPRDKQVMMFSATLEKNIRTVCRRFMNDVNIIFYNASLPIEVSVDDESKLTLHGLLQHYLKVPENGKNRKLVQLLDNLDFNQVIIFVRSIQRCQALTALLEEQNFPVVQIHRAMPQETRLSRYHDFKNFKKRILVATNLFGRGMDIERVNIVINYDMPSDDDTYLHRVGRAGRFDTKGLAITFVSDQNDAGVLNKVQERFEVHITELPDEIQVSSYIDEEIKGKEKHGEKLTKSKDGALVKMYQCIEAAKKNLDILYQKFESELEGKHSADKAELQNILKMLQGLKTSLLGDKQMMEIAKKYGSKTQVFITLEKVKMQIDEQLKQISDAASGSLTEDYSIDSKKAEEVCGLTSVGSVRSVLSSVPAVAKTTLDKLAAFTSNPDSLKRQRLLEIEPHLIKWEVKWSYILPHVSYGATFLDRKVAMVTKDKRIIILNEDGKELCEHNIHCVGEPADINSTSENNVFISFKKQAILKEYYIDEKRITELRTISFENTVEGFWIFDHQIVHASSSFVCISDMDGKFKKRIPSRSYGEIGFLAGSSKNGIYYHTDKSDVCSRKLNEETAAKVSLSAYTNKPRGIGIDFQGNVYVCSYGSNKLLQISTHGSKVRVALDVNCYTIAFHPDGMSFVIIDLDCNVKFYVLSECSH
ncbi:hypothetical protein FSP39_018033 [Pinctada imbricata]|uniref:RNA helicase n=1 Tax=Pinctada imbricata TaxID=66713 RepID=A0AA88Y322_PINIB|nr:hypothetical protein FSP39_018033 [Pinctada imbricata]